MRTLHSRGVRGYLTFKTLVSEHELDAAAKALTRDAGGRGCADCAGYRRIENGPRDCDGDGDSCQYADLDYERGRRGVHAGAGVRRVTLARELSIEEVGEIWAGLEIFVHGALCVAYSGQCFSSEAWGGRSANRGQCAQACRLEYEMVVDGEVKPLADTRYLLSPGDLPALRHVPRIMDAGVASLNLNPAVGSAGAAREAQFHCAAQLLRASPNG